MVYPKTRKILLKLFIDKSKGSRCVIGHPRTQELSPESKRDKNLFRFPNAKSPLHPGLKSRI